MPTVETLLDILHFVIGKPHKVMGAVYLLVVVNTLVTLMRTKAFKASVKEGFETLFAYTSFIVMANVVDMLAIDNLFGWEGSSQFMTCLFGVARELRKAYTYLTERFGFTVPILESRLGEMEQGMTNPNANWQDPSVNLDERIERLRNELDTLEAKRSVPLPETEMQEGGNGL